MSSKRRALKSRLVSLSAKSLSVVLLAILLSTVGCGTIGVKERHTILYASFGEIPEAATGAIRIATNEPVKVTIVGEEEIYTELDICGYYVVSGRDLEAFVDALSSE